MCSEDGPKTRWDILIFMGLNKKLFLGLRNLQNRSLLEVNEDFGNKRNNKRAFLVSPIVFT
jgi:hypothetical protein